MSDAAELEAKMAFDQALALLGAQRTDLKELQSKAKDLIGLLTLAATFLGAFGKAYTDTVLQRLKGEPIAVTVILVVLPSITALAAVYVMTPSSKWIFNIDAESVRSAIIKRPPTAKFSSAQAFYLGYVAVISRFQQQNEKRLKPRKYGVWIATIFLVITVAFTGYLVLSS